MEATKKALAIKKLQTELREEKEAEKTRYVCDVDSQLSDLMPSTFRRREITKERKEAAEERRRLEEDKAKVRMLASFPSSLLIFVSRWAQGRLHDYAGKPVEARKSTASFLTPSHSCSAVCIY